jgi:2-polyprenyl-6-methoxyphenol hydroxylase-like FAD-dependent oxidoreductase
MSTTLHTDVAITGGGVAGSSLAAALAGAGLGVILVEREARFRDRVRGEGVHPWGVKEVEQLGLLPVLHGAGARELPAWQVYRGGEPVFTFRWDDDRPGWPGELAIYHPALQQALIEHAAASGARVLRPARVSGLRRAGGPRLSVSGDDGDYEVRARLVVGADGRQSAARRWLGAETVRDPVHHQLGGCLFDDVDLPDNATHHAFFAGGFALCYPQGGGRARAYVICHSDIAARLRGDVDAFVGQCAAALPEGAVAGVRPAGPLAFFPNADIWAERAAGEGVVLIGDAAGANDPSLGQGLSIGFRDARELRDALLAEPDWEVAITGYAERRAAYYAVLRAHAQWSVRLWTEVGPQADARRARAERARELDPDLGGFGDIIARGPDNLVADEAARRHFFGEDLDPAAGM